MLGMIAWERHPLDNLKIVGLLLEVSILWFIQSWIRLRIILLKIEQFAQNKIWIDNNLVKYFTLMLVRIVNKSSGVFIYSS